MLEVTKPKEITPLSSSKVSPIYRPHEARHQQAETEEKESSHHKSKSSSRKKKQKKSSSNEESNEGRKEKKEERKERKEKKEKKERKERKEKKSSTFSESSVAPDEEEKRRNSSSWQNIFNCQESCPTTPRLDEQSSSKKEDNSSTASTAFSDSNGTPDDEKRMMQIDSGEYSCVPPASALTRMVGAASDVKRSEMKIIIGSIRRDRKEYIKQRSSNSLEETVHRVEEQRKALLVKWQAMSDQRKASGLSSAFLLIDYDKK
jgi:hypothetical protein